MTDPGPGRVTLLSDFGTADGYAAAMAGVIAAAAPGVRIDHASHDIPPGDLLTAALALSRYAFLYPPGTVHLVVVDPGVGTARRAIAARVDGRAFVAPDNGVLTRVLAGADAIVRLPEDAPPPPGVPGTSTTFHGRDLFAPAAARLARGEDLTALGPAVSDPVLLPLPEPRRDGAVVKGEVLQVDRFGNLITSVPAAWIEEKRPRPGTGTGSEGSGSAGSTPPAVAVGDRVIGPVRRTYGDVESGALLALVGSLGLLEVSVRDGSAADRLGVGRGAQVTVRF